MSSNQVRRQIYSALEAKSLRSRKLSTKVADAMTSKSSTPLFLFLNMFFFVVWIVLNLGLLPMIQPFDPYPFGFLTMVVSLEAIFLSIFVLVSQNRAAQIATVREELHLRVDLIAEKEITKILQLLDMMAKKMKLEIDDRELEFMIKDIDTYDMQRSIEDQLKRADTSLVREVFHDVNGLLKLTHLKSEEKKVEKK